MTRWSFQRALSQDFFPRLPGLRRLQVSLGSLRNRLCLVREIPTYRALRSAHRNWPRGARPGR